MDVLEKIWLQIENMINKALLSLINLVLKLRPKWFLKLIEFAKNQVINLKHLIISTIAQSKKRSSERVMVLIIGFKHTVKGYNEKLDKTLKEIKHIKPKDIKNKIIFISKETFDAPFRFIKKSPLHHSFGYLTAISFIMWGVYNLQYSKGLYSQKSKVDRKIASVKEEDPTLKYKKPDYHLKRLRTLPLTNVQLPVLIKGTDFYKSTNVDFSIVSSNKHITLFLDNKEELLRDHLMMHIREIHPEFTLTPEGKKIIEEKILKETNTFIKKYEVEGEIEEVLISNILANP